MEDPYGEIGDISYPLVEWLMEWLGPLLGYLAGWLEAATGNSNGWLWLVALIPPFLYFWTRIQHAGAGTTCRQHSVLFLHALFWIAVFIVIGIVSLGDGLGEQRTLVLLLRNAVLLGTVLLLPMWVVAGMLIGFESRCVAALRSERTTTAASSRGQIPLP